MSLSDSTGRSLRSWHGVHTAFTWLDRNVYIAAPASS